MRILNVADFNWVTGAERDTANLSLFDICRKLSFAATRAGHLVVEYSDRAVARRAVAGAREANRRFLQVVDELRPDLILLHFADKVTNESLHEARRLSPGVLIADVNIDPIDTDKNQRRLALRRGVADALFVTAADPALGQYVEGPAFAAYLPNPVDGSVETGRMFEVEETAFDLLFPVNDDTPRELGEGFVAPSAAIAALAERLPDARFSTPGLGGQPRARGVRYLDALASARAGWSLSRRAAIPLYASDRMVHMMGSGLLTAIDRRAGFQRFYGEGAAVFYDGLDDLAARLRPLLADDGRARETARDGWKITWDLFDSGRVFAYLLAQLFDEGGARGYEWPTARYA